MESSPITGIFFDYVFFTQVNIKLLMWGNCASHEQAWNQRGNKGVLMLTQEKDTWGLTVMHFYCLHYYNTLWLLQYLVTF